MAEIRNRITAILSRMKHDTFERDEALARERLLLKLRQQNDKTLAVSQSRQWSNHDNLKRGNPVKKFSGSL